MTSLSGKSAESSKYKPGELIEVRIRPTVNGGAEVFCERASSNKNMCYEPTKPAAFSTIPEAIDYAKDELGMKEAAAPKAKTGKVEKG